MQLSLLTSFAIVSTLLGSAIAAPVGTVDIKDNGNGTSEADVPGNSQGVEFPFSKEAIIEAVSLGDDIAPIVFDDAVYFINTTKVSQELEGKLGKRDADAEAWRWHRPTCPPVY